ncbi:MAG: hypothetical protein ACM3ML_21420 [Micromonosporaceae bacterium]
MIAELRNDLAGQGLDAGPDTIAWHLAHHHHIRVSPATISCYLARAGLVTPGGRLHHIGIGLTHARTPVLLLIQDLHVRVINAATGELLRELTIDPTAPGKRCAGPRRRISGGTREGCGGCGVSMLLRLPHPTLPRLGTQFTRVHPNT